MRSPAPLLLLVAFLLPHTVAAAAPVQNAKDEATDVRLEYYQQALKFPARVKGGTLTPNWMPDGESFWYSEGGLKDRVFLVQRPDGGQAVLFESAVINEYIEETAPGERMHPVDPLARAHNRAWIEVGSDLLRRMHQLMTAATEEKARQATSTVRALLGRFDEELEGPLFNGERFCLVDATVAPALQRQTWCEEMAPSHDGFSKDLSRVRAWRDLLLARTSVQRSTVPGIRQLFVDRLRAKPTPSWVASQA